MPAMNPLTLQITELDWFPPSRVVISKTHLCAAYRRQIHAQNLIQSAEQQVTATLHRARQQAAALLWQSRKTCRRQRQQCQAAIAELKAQSIRDSETEWMENHIHWLVQSATMEQQLIEHVKENINQCMKQVVTVWCDGQAIEPLLIARLSAQVQNMAKEQSLTLRIHPQHAEQAQISLGAQLQVIPDPALELDRGILCSALLTIDISLHRHWEQLQQWLCPATVEQEENCYVD